MNYTETNARTSHLRKLPKLSYWKYSVEDGKNPLVAST